MNKDTIVDCMVIGLCVFFVLLWAIIAYNEQLI